MTKYKENEKEVIKIILVGDSGVGKTNLINTSIGLGFKQNGNGTVSGSFVSKNIQIKNKKYIANLWDTAGQEVYRGITQLFFRGSEIIILVYDICNPLSFESLESWYKLCEETINNEHIFAIVGNKNDLFMNSKINKKDAEKFAESKNAKFRLVSAKTDPNSFIKFIEELIKDYKNIANQTRRQSIKIKRNDKKKENCCNNNNSKKGNI